MKCAIVLTEGIKQIMLTPENDSEKQALRMITRDDDITIETKWGEFYDNKPVGYNVVECGAGYLRGFQSDDSLMLVLKRKVPSTVASDLYHAIRKEAGIEERQLGGPQPCPPVPPAPASTDVSAGSQSKVDTSAP